MLHTHLAGLALAAATLAASGCGGASKTESTTAVSTTTPTTGKAANTQPLATLSSAELIAKTNVICARVNAERASTTIRTPQDYARVLPQLAAYEQAAVAELRKLVPPAAIATDWHQIVAGVQTIADDTTKFGEYAQVNDLKAVQTLVVRDASVQKALSAAAKRDGFTNCASTS